MYSESVCRERYMRFPTNWPQGCPPQDASDAEGCFYRCVESSPPTEVDFKSAAELGRCPTAPACQRVGLSLLPTVEDAKHQMQLFPAKNKYIAEGKL